ncbi:MAG: ornithine cyclodeaminase family protein [Rubrivivax sp.]|nr:ornithine cyclodeaminase family protein [Rubrivivax sp.]
MIRVYAADEVHAALPWLPLMAALSAAFAAGAEVPLRHAHALDAQDTLLLMPAWNAQVLGTKIVTVMPGNAARGEGTVQAVYLLQDRRSGETLALMDGEALTLRRTAAASALAARYLARADASRLLVVGTGRLAEWLARAHAAARPGLRQLRVWGRRPQAVDALVQRLGRCEELARVQIQPAHDLRTALADCDIVSCATTATEPLLPGDALCPGTHLDLVGSFKPSMREADDEAVRRALVVVDTYAGALEEAGELVGALQRGVIGRGHITADLAELARGERPGRTHPEQLTLFKSVGTALEDLAAAQAVWSAGPTLGNTAP